VLFEIRRGVLRCRRCIDGWKTQGTLDRDILPMVLFKFEGVSISPRFKRRLLFLHVSLLSHGADICFKRSLFGPSAAVIGSVRCDDPAVPLVMNITCCEEIFPPIIPISNPKCIHFRFTKVTVIRLLVFQM